MKSWFNIVLLFLLSSTSLLAEEIKVKNITEYEKAVEKMQPGDEIVLANGDWESVRLVFGGEGTAEQPIVLRAETAGKVKLIGKSDLRLWGKHLLVKGLYFEKGSAPKRDVISFRVDSKKFATDSRVSECVIVDYNGENRSKKVYWVNLWGQRNRVDHCYFAGKKSVGVTLVVWLQGREHFNNHHRIDHNHFGPRPSIGSNGGETIRVGTSFTSMVPSHTVVELNKFERCDGEVEIISNKSCNNIYRNNLFYECQGSVVMRHGNFCSVEGNVFLGNGVEFTGGVRIINTGHVVRNNYFYGLTGEDFRGPLTIMNGAYHSPMNRYNQVTDAVVANNTWVNCTPLQLCAGSDEERQMVPIRTTFANNLLYNEEDSVPFNIFDKVDEIRFKENYIGGKLATALQGFKAREMKWKKAGSFWTLPLDGNGSLKAKGYSTPEVTDLETDITGAKRTGKADVGAWNLDNHTMPVVMTAKAFGPTWFNEISKKPPLKIKTIRVKPGKGTLEKAVKEASSGSILELKSGVYEVSKKMSIDKNLVIQGKPGKKRPILKVTNTDTPDRYFRIHSGKLTLRNLDISGKADSAVKYMATSPKEYAPAAYSLFIENCNIHDFKHETGSMFKAYKRTVADTILVRNSHIDNCNRGFSLNSETDDRGTYNSIVVILENTVFSNIRAYALNYYRGGNDESTVGGQLMVDHCVFSNVNNNAKQTMLRTHGIIYVTVRNSVFENSPNANYAVKLAGRHNHISNCLVYKAGDIKIENKASKAGILTKDPVWKAKSDFKPAKNSPLLKAADDGGNIGLML